MQTVCLTCENGAAAGFKHIVKYSSTGNNSLEQKYTRTLPHIMVCLGSLLGLFSVYVCLHECVCGSVSIYIGSDLDSSWKFSSIHRKHKRHCWKLKIFDIFDTYLTSIKLIDCVIPPGDHFLTATSAYRVCLYVVSVCFRLCLSLSLYSPPHTHLISSAARHRGIHTYTHSFLFVFWSLIRRAWGKMFSWHCLGEVSTFFF